MVTPARLALVLAVVLAGCGGEGRCGLQLCDIRQPACQRMAAEAAGCLRGQEPVTTPIEVISKDEYLMRHAAGASAGADPGRFRATVRGLSLFGLMPAELTVDEAAAQTAWAAAYYSPQDKRVTIVDWGHAMDSRDMVSVLVHELVHAMQDVYYGFDPLFGAHALDTDSALALRAVIEGDASLVDDFATLALFGTPVRDVGWDRVLGRWRERDRSTLPTVEAPLLLLDLFFVYSHGQGLVYDAWRGNGWAGVEALYQGGIPAVTRQVLEGPGASEPAGGPWREELGDEAVPLLPEAYELIYADRLGAWGVEAFLWRLSGGHPEARTWPRFLRADTLSVQFEAPTDSLMAVWRLRFADEASARSTRDLVAARAPERGLQVWGRGRDVILAAAVGRASQFLKPDLAFRPVVQPMPPAPTAPGRLIVCPPRRWWSDAHDASR